MKFRSLRWRIASFYALLLLGVIAIVAIVLTLQLRTILSDEARAKVDRVGNDIAQVVHGNSALSALGDTLPIEEELTSTGVLDHWSGPTTYVEIDTANGYPIAKSTNMGGASFATSTDLHGTRPVFRQQNVSELGGDVLVRDEYIEGSGIALIVKVGESLAIYDETLGRVRGLLAVVVVLAASVVVGGSFAIASSAIDPIGRLTLAMSQIRSDRLSARLAWNDRSDELGRLADSFDAMLDRLEDGFTRERQFISDASHELKTPLTVINANAQMLERWADRDPEVRAESVRAIKDESSALAEMVNGMLLLAKAESGEDVQREPVALTNVVAEAVRATASRAADKHLALRFARADGAAPIVLGNANLLRQLFTNLIDNAIKFTLDGAIDVSVAPAGPTDVVVAVSDTGIGIEDEALERVFDRFFRADASRNRTIAGTGLGLAIVRSIATIHGGRVTAEKRAGGGTTFRVTLPTLTPLQ